MPGKILKKPAGFYDTFTRKAGDQTVEHRFGEGQGAAQIADRAAGPVGDHVADHGGVLPSVALVDILDDLFPALGIEVDVDIGRSKFVAAQKALEEQVDPARWKPIDQPDLAGQLEAARGNVDVAFARFAEATLGVYAVVEVQEPRRSEGSRPRVSTTSRPSKGVLPAGGRSPAATLRARPAGTAHSRRKAPSVAGA